MLAKMIQIIAQLVTDDAMPQARVQLIHVTGYAVFEVECVAMKQENPKSKQTIRQTKFERDHPPLNSYHFGFITYS